MPRPPTVALAAASLAASLAALSAAPGRARAQAFTFNTGDVDGRMAIGARPGAPLEIEPGDDFVTSRGIRLTSATFTGLVPANFALGDATFARVQIYRLFPADSEDPPLDRVPTRDNSPADNALLARETGAGLTFTTTTLAPSFTAANSVLDGINPLPGVTTGGEGPRTGQLVRFNVTFTQPITLAAGHYFFAPQAGLTSGDFFWLSSVRPIAPPGTPFAPDLQVWVRNEELAPDWLRVGTDIVGGEQAPTFNAAFSLDGTVVPEPSSAALVAAGLGAAGAVARRRRRASA